jgi:crotonobetainyl-CoA:carnitine CoA-transferase CaiB-like acyl-CoA transferase
MLEGIRVLCFTHFIQGPVTAQLLGDFGAEVIKVEAPSGPYERTWAGMDAFHNGMSDCFLIANRNQRSLSVDMRAEEGREILSRLIEHTDAIVENFRPGVLEKYGFGYDQLKEKHPSLVYASLSGFGPTGPYKGRPGQDMIAQGLSGLASVSGRSTHPPVTVGASVVDMHSAALAAFGVVAALLDAKRTGKGHKIDSCLINAAMDLQMEIFGCYLSKGYLFDKLPTGAATRAFEAPYGVYETSDGHIILSKTPIPKCRILFGAEHFEGFKDDEIYTKREEIDRIASREMKKKTTAEWEKIFAENDCWFSRINEYDDVVKDPQVIHNGMIMEMDHPVAGKIKMLGNPLIVDGETLPIRIYPPLQGEHTVDILTECGYSQKEIDSLLEKKIAICKAESKK